MRGREHEIGVGDIARQVRSEVARLDDAVQLGQSHALLEQLGETSGRFARLPGLAGEDGDDW